MALAIESIGWLFTNISVFNMGMALGLIMLILAISRSISKNKDNWAMTFTMYAWGLALIIPTLWFSGLIFGVGALTLLFSYMPMVHKISDKNIFVLAILAVSLNLLLLLGTGSYDLSLSWQDDLDKGMDDVETLFGARIDEAEDASPAYVLCKPNQLDSTNSSCQSDAIAGSFNENIFVPLASILTIGTYAGKAIAFAGMVILAPIVLSNVLVNGGYFTNAIIISAMTWIIILWEMVIFYKLILFVLNRKVGK